MFVEYIWEDTEKRKETEEKKRDHDVLVRRPIIIRNNAQFVLSRVFRGESCSSCKTIDRNTTVENSTRLGNISSLNVHDLVDRPPNPSSIRFVEKSFAVTRCMFSVFREWTINTLLHCKTRKRGLLRKDPKTRGNRERNVIVFFLFLLPLLCISSSHFDLGCQP